MFVFILRRPHITGLTENMKFQMSRKICVRNLFTTDPTLAFSHSTDDEWGKTSFLYICTRHMISGNMFKMDTEEGLEEKEPRIKYYRTNKAVKTLENCKQTDLAAGFDLHATINGIIPPSGIKEM